MNLFDGALIPYDELEDSFHLVWREKNMSWFGNLINLGPADDSSPLLSITKKPYRDLILANTISVFDFRIYLLSRQCELLAKLGRLSEVTRRVGSFLATFGWHLREIEVRSRHVYEGLCLWCEWTGISSTILHRVVDLLIRAYRG